MDAISYPFCIMSFESSSLDTFCRQPLNLPEYAALTTTAPKRLLAKFMALVTHEFHSCEGQVVLAGTKAHDASADTSQYWSRLDQTSRFYP